MHISSHMMSNVQTLDVGAMKAAQDPEKTNEIKAKLGGLAERVASAKAHAAANPDAKYDFNRRATSSMKSLYNSAKAGTVNGFSFKSREDAVKHASTIMSNLNSFADAINRMGGGDISLEGKFNSPFTAEQRAAVPEFELHYQMSKDDLAVSRMNLIIESEIMAKSFDIDEPLFEVEDGKVKIRSFDLNYGGEPIMRSIGDGRTAEYRADGSLKVDSYA